ncbi:hypothetical protein Goklo_024550 [Gossypium klotzschianum]|uniref:Uncharacterized protein n=1 Tax=Gossypium klotzschianum TaxID=34286 RepID=A0A7J8W795_9ROSI|nr:hypothetical protein [Gossypium klotzschianum]
MALLRCLKIQVDKVYSKAINVPTFLKRLMNIIGMSEQWVTTRIKQKGDSKCIPWKNLKDLILAHLDAKKKDFFAWNLGSCWLCPIVSTKAIEVKAVCARNSGTGRV